MNLIFIINDTRESFLLVFFCLINTSEIMRFSEWIDLISKLTQSYTHFCRSSNKKGLKEINKTFAKKLLALPNVTLPQHVYIHGNWDSGTFIFKDTGVGSDGMGGEKQNSECISKAEYISRGRIIKSSVVTSTSEHLLLMEWLISKLVAPHSPFVLRALGNPFVLRGLPSIRQPRCCMDLHSAMNTCLVDDSELVFIILAMMSVLCSASSRRFTHGDLRPENIFLNECKSRAFELHCGKKQLKFQKVSIMPFMADFGMSMFMACNEGKEYLVGYNDWTSCKIDRHYDVVFFFSWLYVYYHNHLQTYYPQTFYLVERVVCLTESFRTTAVARLKFENELTKARLINGKEHSEQDNDVDDDDVYDDDDADDDDDDDNDDGDENEDGKEIKTTDKESKTTAHTTTPLLASSSCSGSEDGDRSVKNSIYNMPQLVDYDILLTPESVYPFLVDLILDPLSNVNAEGIFDHSKWN